VLKQFGALPTEARARKMKERDYVWCLVNELLDDEEALERMCPTCRARAQEPRCPVCGAPAGQGEGEMNPSFDMARFLALKGEKQE
jgi:hypothetical protein